MRQTSKNTYDEDKIVIELAGNYDGTKVPVAGLKNKSPLMNSELLYFKSVLRVEAKKF